VDLNIGEDHKSNHEVIRTRELPPSVSSDRLFTYSKEQLLKCGEGLMHGLSFPPLPSPPMLMFDEVTDIDPKGGAAGKGVIEARLAIDPSLWFFACHFKKDPVMPGCLGLDALWQLLGFYLGWLGAKGRGRALGAKDVRFSGQVLPENKEVLYRVELSRVKTSPLFMGVGKGVLICDGKTLYEVEGLRVGVMPTADA
jgi:3-hydroxyacyl-[acyl-carrier protein] dehydratase/trans-2-decenoyl-[acyl-carrier protein] isomerase